METCGCEAVLKGRVGLRPLFFRFLRMECEVPEHDTQNNVATDLQSEIESRLAESEPSIELLLVDVIGTGRSAALRLFIDSPDGVDHDLCARVTNNLRDLLVDYTVEVSSPGP